MGMQSLIKNLFLFICVVLTYDIVSAKLIFQNLNNVAIEIEAPGTSGLKKIYVITYIDGVGIGVENVDAKWQRFSAMGAAYAEDVESVNDGNTSLLRKPEGNVGYAVTIDGKTDYYWIVNHSAYPFALRDINLNPADSDCLTSFLNVDGEGERIPYYSITGLPQWLDRGLELTYSTLEFDKENFAYIQIEKTEIINGFSDEIIHCTAPLCQTDFTLVGDRFLKQWGQAETVTSPVYDPTSVAMETRATQTPRENDNEIKVESTLGGSGPVEITFEGAVSDAAIFHEWEMARDADFQQIFMRSPELEFTYTFREQGTVYVRMTVANDDGTCETSGETYEVFVGESQLKCPNAFSPGTSPGVNDEWKVSYKSIIEFECHIFDRQGRRLAHLTEPSQGWDGKRGGKTVGPGVYFYVIHAKGADGKNYNLSGDINVIGHTQRKTTNDATE